MVEIVLSLDIKSVIQVVSLKKGDFVLVDYVVIITESGEIFDSTKKDVAKEKGIFNPKLSYGPVPIIIGSGLGVKGLEDGLKKMNVGEKKKIKVSPEKAFGKRNSKLIKLFPISRFKEQDISPYPGMPVIVKNLQGRVMSVSGGRVKVDFNHPLAGKSLEYDVEIKKKITGKKDKVEAVLEMFFGDREKNIDVKTRKSEAEIKLRMGRDVPKRLKQKVANTITKWIKGIKKVKFVEEY